MIKKGSETLKIEEVTGENDSIKEENASIKEETTPVQEDTKKVAEEKFVLKVGKSDWMKSWSPFVLCKKKSDAMELNADWARGHCKRIISYKHLQAEIVKL